MTRRCDNEIGGRWRCAACFCVRGARGYSLSRDDTSNDRGSPGGKATIDRQGHTRLTACLFGVFALFGLTDRLWPSGSMPYEHNYAEHGMPSIKCSAKPCVSLSIDGTDQRTKRRSIMAEQENKEKNGENARKTRTMNGGTRRPRQTAQKSESTAATVVQDKDTDAPKKRRGRPPKNPRPDAMKPESVRTETASAGKTDAPKRRPGRPAGSGKKPAPQTNESRTGGKPEERGRRSAGERNIDAARRAGKSAAAADRAEREKARPRPPQKRTAAADPLHRARRPQRDRQEHGGVRVRR